MRLKIGSENWIGNWKRHFGRLIQELERPISCSNFWIQFLGQPASEGGTRQASGTPGQQGLSTSRPSSQPASQPASVGIVPLPDPIPVCFLLNRTETTTHRLEGHPDYNVTTEPWASPWARPTHTPYGFYNFNKPNGVRGSRLGPATVFIALCGPASVPPRSRLEFVKSVLFGFDTVFIMKMGTFLRSRLGPASVPPRSRHSFYKAKRTSRFCVRQP